MDNGEQQPFAGAIIVMFVIALIIVGGGVYGYLYYTGQVSFPFSGSSASGSPDAGNETADGQGDSYDPTAAEGDINDDGNVDFLDSRYISDHGGCASDDPCWSEVIDHTVTGHNPIYTSDLDLNQDGEINDADAVVITNYSQ